MAEAVRRRTRPTGTAQPLLVVPPPRPSHTGAAADPSDDPQCEVDAAGIKVDVAGLPSQLVAGGGWTRFSVRLANTTDRALDEVFPVIYAVPTAEHRSTPGRRSWTWSTRTRTPAGGPRSTSGPSGRYFGWFRLDPHRTAELTLRIRADKGAAAR